MLSPNMKTNEQENERGTNVLCKLTVPSLIENCPTKIVKDRERTNVRNFS